MSTMQYEQIAAALDDGTEHNLQTLAAETISWRRKDAAETFRRFVQAACEAKLGLSTVDDVDLSTVHITGENAWLHLSFDTQPHYATPKVTFAKTFSRGSTYTVAGLAAVVTFVDDDSLTEQQKVMRLKSLVARYLLPCTERGDLVDLSSINRGFAQADQLAAHGSAIKTYIRLHAAGDYYLR